MKANTRKQQKRNEKEDRRQRIAMTEPDAHIDDWMWLPNTEAARNRLISVTTPHERKSTSYHEAGHAVIDELAGLAVEFVTALPIYNKRENSWVKGMVELINEIEIGGATSAPISQIVGLISATLAGELAQEKAGYKPSAAGMTGDDRSYDQLLIEHLAAEMSLHFGVVFTAEEFYRDGTLDAKHKLDDPQVWSAIEALAARLQESEVVQGDEVRRIISRCCGAAKVAGA
jgi:hypothetical protein